MEQFLHCEGMDCKHEESKLAITTWGGRVSPMFDAAQTLLVVEKDCSGVFRKKYRFYKPENLHQFLELFTANRIQVLICGAITKDKASFIESSGITCFSFVTGTIEEVLATYTNGSIYMETLKMPGCNPRKKHLKEV